MRIRPYIHPEVADFLKEEDNLFSILQLHHGPIHLLFPKVMDENISKFRTVFNELELDGKIYYAHKANKSQAFVKRALKNNIGIEVASKEELISALACGFTGQNIICGGPKSREYVWLAVKQRCTISVDSIEELQIVEQYSHANKTSVLIRVSDLASEDRKMFRKISKFGIPQSRLEEVFSLINNSNNINLLGFHFHIDIVQNSASAVSYINSILRIMHEAYSKNLAPTVIDIGGGFRTKRLLDENDWVLYLEELKNKLIDSKPLETWNNISLGLTLDQGTLIRGREKFLSWLLQPEYITLLKEVFSNKNTEGIQLSDRINDALFSLYVEPGYAALANAGITVLKVTSVKKLTNGDQMIIVNGNMYSLSLTSNEWLVDPVHISKKKKKKNGEYFIGGNLCRGSDMVMRKKIALSYEVNSGDLLCFINTAAYYSDFEDTNPHLLPMGKKYIIEKVGEKFEVFSEEVYNPNL